MGGVTSKESRTSSSKAHFCFADVFSHSTYRVSSSSVLQALGKFLPVIYQQGTTTSQGGSCPPCPQAKYHIGDFAEGGVIIWLTEDGNHGLVAAIEDVTEGPSGQGTKFQWGPNPSSTKGVENNDSPPFSTPMAPYGQYYGGYKNQTASDIVNNLTTYPAFWAAANYSKIINGTIYDDWWLPCPTELCLMFAIRDKINKVSKANGGSEIKTGTNYWSSYQITTNLAWNILFFLNIQDTKRKDAFWAVRCVRAF